MSKAQAANAQAAAAAAASKIDLTWASENVPCWIMLPEDDPSGEACGKGTVVKLIDDENASVLVDGAKEAKNMRGDKIYAINNYKEAPEGFDDMVDMEHLSEAELLENMRVRFMGDMIYTYVGPTLIVLNPYKRIEKLLVPGVLRGYQDSLLQGKFEPKEHKPHVYAIAAMTMKNLFDNLKNQAIVISGESGAGKTENTKSAMKFLTSLGKSEEDVNNNNGENIEDKILACNPVLEAFGNAKTVRNDNSSRFGKYVALLVEKDTRKIIGATITNYLLEKSRVVGQNSEERNYHIFYALLRGATPESLSKLCLTNNLEDWALLKNAFKGIVKTVPDPELYKEVTDSFNTMKFSQEEQEAVWCYTAASLMVGNLDFDESTFSDASPCQLKNDGVLVNAAKILGIDFERLSKALRYKTRVVAGSAIESTIKREECLIFRDSLSKDLFNKLFNWLVRRLNFTVMPPEFTKNGIDMNALMNKYYHIGLLDIFGFEIFNFNSIEQFCINFANEKLQQLYISYVFKGEEKEFINEGLKEFLGELNFKDNQVLIDMLDHNKLPGIFQMVDESCSVNATDQNLYDKIIKQFKKPEFPLTTQKIAKDTFIVKHTAKEVEYNINGFRAKNKDEISKTIEDAVFSSSMPEVVKIWKNLCLTEVESEESKNAKANPKDKFLGYKFRSQMKELMDELNSCECHFIRCLKPNEKKQFDCFLPQLVLQQIKYMGVLDTIKVRKDSFPVRTPYKNFYEKYQELDRVNSKIPFEKHVEKGADFKELAKGICAKKVPHLGTKMILYGNNKMFLRVEAAKEVEKLRREWENMKHRSARKIQRAWFKFKHERLFRKMLKGVKEVQKMYKVSKEYLKFLKLRKKTLILQRWWRRVLYKRKLKKMNEAAVVIQRWWKMKFYTKRYLKTKESAQVVNKLMRGAMGRKKASIVRYCRAIVKEIVNRGATELFEKVKIGAAKIIQKFAKGYVCRKRLASLIQQVKQAKEDFVRNKHARVIQKKARGFIVKSSYVRMRRAAVFIQGHMKMRWLSNLFQKLRTVSIKIQKAVKKWYIRRKVIKERMQKYMSTDGKTYKSLLIAEQVNFFGVNNIGKVGKNVDSQTGKLTGKDALFFGNESFINSSVAPFHHSDRSFVSDTLKGHSMEAGQYNSYANLQDAVNGQNDPNQNYILNAPKEYDPYGSKKVQLFTKVLDVDILTDTSLMYDPMWSIQILKLQNECNHTDTDLQLIEVGQAHTTVVPSNGKLYSFGWNDCFQLGRPTQVGDTVSSCAQISLPIENFRPKSMAAGDDHNLVLDYQGNLYVWGDNSKGQLGLGHCRETSRMTILDFLSNDTITEIKAKGNNSLVLTQTGKVFYWPIQLNSGEKIYRPAELGLPPKVLISTASCGHNFTALVSKNGLVFTFGRDNQAGQLGHGDNVSRDTPALVETLKNEGENIISVSCGYKHVICKSKLGKVYTWGWGKQGQLGHGETNNELKPKLVNVCQNTAKAKVLQVQAGFKHSMVILDNKKIMWWGTNASLECQPVPIEVNLQKKIPGYHKDFTPLKVLCAWSKTMNITYVVMADTRAADLNPMMKQKLLSTLSSKIEETSGLNDVDLPYIESIAKHFSMKVMKDRTVKDSKTGKATNTLKKTNGTVTGNGAGIGTGSGNMGGMKFTGKNIEVGGPPHYSDSLQKSRASPRPSADDSFLNKTQQSIFSAQKSPRGMVHSKSSTAFLHKSPRGQVPPIQFGNLQSEQAPKSSRTQRSTSRESEKSSKRLSPARKLREQKEDQLNSLGQKLMEIKRRVQEIMSSPMESWSKTDVEFIKMATEPKMLELLQNVKI